MEFFIKKDKHMWVLFILRDGILYRDTLKYRSYQSAKLVKEDFEKVQPEAFWARYEPCFIKVDNRRAGL
jgi:uncharacterized protein (DUF2461 family)